MIRCHSCGESTTQPVRTGWGVDFAGRWVCEQCRWPLLARPENRPVIVRLLAAAQKLFGPLKRPR